MSGCRAAANSKPEIDGLHDLLDTGDQAMFDVASGREQRRETQGYVAPPQARAFLEASRRLRFGADTAPPVDPIARAHLRTSDSSAAPDAHDVRERLQEGTPRSMTIMPNRSRPSSKSCATQASLRHSLARCSLRRTLTLRACNTSRHTCSSCSSATTWSLAEERRDRLSRKHDRGGLLSAGTPTFGGGSVGCRYGCLQSRARELAATLAHRAGAQRRRAHRDGAARRLSTRPRSRHRVSSGMDGPSRQRRHARRRAVARCPRHAPLRRR